MTGFSVYAPPLADDEARLEKARFIPERPAFWAFILPPVWLVGHGLWLALIFWFAAMAGLGALANHIGDVPGGYAVIAFWLWFGFSARDIERLSLLRAGWTLAGLVTARKAAEAEQAFFQSEATGHEGAPRPRPAEPTNRPGRGPGTVLGFEGMGGGRA